MDGQLVTVEAASATDTGADLIVRLQGGDIRDRTLSWVQLADAAVPENDGAGDPSLGLAGLYGQWMRYVTPRIRSAALATRELDPLAHQDEAVFDEMLPQPKLRFLLADEPGTGKTIMTGMYLREGRRRGLVAGASIIVVPAHLVLKWQEELEDFFGIQASVLTREVALDPMDLDPRVSVWLVSLDLYTGNPDVRRKAAGSTASWSLAVFDEAHRLTPTSRYLGAAQELAARSHHLLLLTATPHRGKEHFFRGLCHLLNPALYPWDPDHDSYDGPLRPSRMSFLRRMKEELRGPDGNPLFPNRFAETVPVELGGLEMGAYQAVMEYAQQWYGENSTLALSIYGKRAASGLPAARETLLRRLDALSGAAATRGRRLVPESFAKGLRSNRLESSSFENPDDIEAAEEALVSADTIDKKAEIEAVETVLAKVRAAIEQGGTPAKWTAAQDKLALHGIRPGAGQALVFTEFTDTAFWLRDLFAEAGYTVEILYGEVDQRARHGLQQRFLDGDFQVLVSTDAGGEGINLQSAHVMIDWDIPWSLVRLEQRMGRLHRIGQTNDVFVYHLVAPATREGRVQEVMLHNLETAGESLGGRIFDLLDATVANVGGFDFAEALARAQADPDANVEDDVPTVDELREAGAALAEDNRRLSSKVDHAAAEARFRHDRVEAINPVFVDRFVDTLAAAQGWTVAPGPAEGIRSVRADRPLPPAFAGGLSRLFASSGTAVYQARADGAAGLDDVTVLGPTEDAFTELVDLAVGAGRPELLRGVRLVDTGSFTDYQLLVYEAEVRMHDGVRQVARPAPLLVRWSGGGAIEMSWECLLNLEPATGPAAERPTPAQLADTEAQAKQALVEEIERQKTERLDWVAKARRQLTEVENRLIDEIRDLPRDERDARRAAFDTEKRHRSAQLDILEDVQPTGVRLVGWAQVTGGADIAAVGYNPSAEKVAISVVVDELERLGFSVDDRQTAGVGYDLLARHKTSGEQRLVEVKGELGDLGPVWLEQNEWSQALQRGSDYWLYVVANCDTDPVVEVRAQDPVRLFAGAARQIQRFQIKLSQLREHTP